MMHHHRCSSYGVDPCNCGLFHNHAQANSSFSMLFKSSSSSYDENDQYHQMLYPNFASPSNSSSVDCTLSLGTPSTRLSGGDHRRSTAINGARGGRSGSNFGCWDFLQGKSQSSSGSSGGGYNNQSHKGGSSNTGGGGGSGNSNNGMVNSDPLLARRCANCDTTSTPLWRNGPRGPKSLCNACGIRFKKEERRATAANASATASCGGMDHYTYQNNNNNDTWANNNTQKMPCFSPASEFRFIDDSDSTTHHHDFAGGGNIPFLSWRLNVTDRPTGLVHDFTR